MPTKKGLSKATQTATTAAMLQIDLAFSVPEQQVFNPGARKAQDTWQK